MVPLIVAAPLGGLLADRFDRRKLIALGYAVNLLQALLLAILIAFEVVQVWQVVIFAFISGCVRAMIMPSMQALVPNLVPRRDLLNAVALSGIAMHGSRIGGPGLAAPLLATVGVGGAFLLSVFFYAAGIFFVLRVHTVSTGEVRSEQGMVRNLAEGLVYAYRHATIGLIILLVALHCSLTMSFESMLPVFSQRELGAGGSVFSVLIMATGGGALIGVLDTSQPDKQPLDWLVSASHGTGQRVDSSSPCRLLHSTSGVLSRGWDGGLSGHLHGYYQYLSAERRGGPRAGTRLQYLHDARRRHNGIRQPDQRLSGRSVERACHSRNHRIHIHWLIVVAQSVTVYPAAGISERQSSLRLTPLELRRLTAHWVMRYNQLGYCGV